MVVKIELEVRMAVKIVRVLNTNAVVSSDQEGRELIITGAGIGFKKKKGENLDEALADKTYYLESVDDSRRLQEVVKEISEEYLEIVSRIVKTAREEGLKVRDSLYVTLTDHINSAVDRYRENIALKNMMKLEIRKFYPKEYEIGLRAVQWIQEQNDENLGEDEAAFIAMHIVSAELGSGSNVDVNKITKLINAVLQIVRIHFKIEFNEKSISYERFLTHLWQNHKKPSLPIQQRRFSLNYSSPVFSLASTSFRLVHSMVYRPRISSSAGSRSGTITVTKPPAAPARTPL